MFSLFGLWEDQRMLLTPSSPLIAFLIPYTQVYLHFLCPWTSLLKASELLKWQYLLVHRNPPYICCSLAGLTFRMFIPLSCKRTSRHAELAFANVLNDVFTHMYCYTEFKKYTVLQIINKSRFFWNIWSFLEAVLINKLLTFNFWKTSVSLYILKHLTFIFIFSLLLAFITRGWPCMHQHLRKEDSKELRFQSEFWPYCWCRRMQFVKI